jgi:OOP family OmpA-OmpF porin
MQAKKIILGVAAVGLSTAIAASAVAAQPGFYAGVQAGYGNLHLGSGIDNKDKGLAGRISGGYQFNNNFGAEMGWSKFHTVEQKYSTAKASLKTDVVDLVAKGTVPVADNFSVYGKLGGAYVMQRVDVTNHGHHVHLDKDSEKKVLPTAGVGVSYDFSPNVAADVSYTRIQKTGSSDINSIDFFGAGLTYSFG